MVNGTDTAITTDLDCDSHDDILWYGPGAERDVLWRGGHDRRFRDAPMSVSGHYVPATGDFDGDGCGDVLWYGPGTAPDSLWYGGPTVSSVPVVVDGEGLHPVVGDLDGDQLGRASGGERECTHV